MKKWIRKSFVVMVSLLTFGLITPAQPGFLDRIKAENDSSERGTFNANDSLSAATKSEALPDRDTMIENMVKLAKDRSYEKFGTKIKPVIENEFEQIILPKIESAITETAMQFPDEDLAALAISEQPGGGRSEKIFNIKDSRTGKHIIRFHVRRDNPPQSGYWFNFHYHTFDDNFTNHHELGSIYWDKNMPPKWMA
ncbi:YpjP family protein [Bacillus sp. B-jedd]|uniref:YpjP family protein n=1 Tax=Bacillus sp. B-jedd TaxID=1476857 RepID=UPI0005156B07|nr:YpjP family protein [Bacillus sp. B-jedd]CEG27564.1 tetracycline resistance protein [Bacillus sp. B-jedd]